MKENILLSVLIPTYNRPESLIKSVNSCISNDERVEILVNSNGPQKELDYLTDLNKYLKYSYFKENRGFHNNLKFLLKKAKGKFSLILSDEDCLNTKYLEDLLNWLLINSNISIGFCDIVNEDGTYYFKSKSESITFNYFRFVSPYVHTYISGYIINNKYLDYVEIDKLLINNQANAYPHVILKYHLLKKNSGKFFSKKIITRGEEVKTGGDAYSQSNDFLNFKIYGSYARSLQYLYLKEQFSKLNQKKLSNGMYKINLALDFYSAIFKSNSLTGQKDIYLKEFSRANKDMLMDGLMKKKSKFMCYLIKYGNNSFVHNTIKFLRISFTKVLSIIIK